MGGRRSPARNVGFVLACLLAVIVACGGVGTHVVRRWAEGALGEMAGQAEQTQADARAFGATHTQPECEVEGMRRGPDTCTDLQIPCMIDAAVFLHTCLQTAPALPETCEGVPSRDTPVEAGSWLAGECARRGYRTRPACSQILQNGLLRYCDENR